LWDDRPGGRHCGARQNGASVGCGGAGRLFGRRGRPSRLRLLPNGNGIICFKDVGALNDSASFWLYAYNVVDDNASVPGS